MRAGRPAARESNLTLSINGRLLRPGHKQRRKDAQDRLRIAANFLISLREIATQLTQVTQSDFELCGQSTTRIAELTRDHQPGKSEAAYFRPVRTRRSCGKGDVASRSTSNVHCVTRSR